MTSHLRDVGRSPRRQPQKMLALVVVLAALTAGCVRAGGPDVKVNALDAELEQLAAGCRGAVAAQPGPDGLGVPCAGLRRAPRGVERDAARHAVEDAGAGAVVLAVALRRGERLEVVEHADSGRAQLVARGRHRRVVSIFCARARSRPSSSRVRVSVRTISSSSSARAPGG